MLPEERLITGRAGHDQSGEEDTGFPAAQSRKVGSSLFTEAWGREPQKMPPGTFVL